MADNKSTNPRTAGGHATPTSKHEEGTTELPIVGEATKRPCSLHSPRQHQDPTASEGTGQLHPEEHTTDATTRRRTSTRTTSLGTACLSAIIWSCFNTWMQPVETLGITDDTATAAFIPHGQLLIASAIIHVPVYFDLKPMFKNCEDMNNLFKKDLPQNLISDTHLTMWYQYKSFVKEMCQEFHDFYDITIRHQNRQPRDIGTAFGIAGSMFGLYNWISVRNIKQQLDNEQWESKQQIELFTEEITSLNHTIHLIAATLDNRTSTLAAELSLIGLGIQTLSTKTRLHELENGIVAAQHGRLSTHIIPLPQLERIHANVTRLAEHHLATPAITELADYFDVPLTLSIEDQTLHILVHVPAITQTLRLHRYQPIPFQLEDNTYLIKGGNQYMIAVDDQDQFHADVTADELQDCWKVNNHFICHHNTVLYEEMTSTCLGAMWQAHHKKILQLCRIKPLQDFTIVNLKEQVVIFAPNNTRVRTVCPGDTEAEVQDINGLAHVDVKPGCTIHGKNFKVTHPINELARTPVIVSLDWTNASWEINLNPDRRTQDALNKQDFILQRNNALLKRLHNNHPRTTEWWITLAIFIGVAGIAIVIGLAGCYLTKRKLLHVVAGILRRFDIHVADHHLDSTLKVEHQPAEPTEAPAPRPVPSATRSCQAIVLTDHLHKLEVMRAQREFAFAELELNRLHKNRQMKQEPGQDQPEDESQ